LQPGRSVGDVQERLKYVTASSIVPRHPEAIANPICEMPERGERSNGYEHILELNLDHVAERVVSVYKAIMTDTNPQQLASGRTRKGE
jgi:hypothetical protein